MPEQDVRALGASVDRLIRLIDQETREIRPLLASLERLPEMMRDAQQGTQQALSDLQSITVQLKLADVTTELEADRGTLAEEEQALQNKTEELKSDLDRIADRYRKLLDDVDRETNQHIRALDQPVLDILEKLYPNTIDARYGMNLLPGRTAIAAKGEQTQDQRHRALARALEWFQSAVAALQEARRAPLETIAAWRRAPTGPLPAERLIPVFVVRNGGKYDYTLPDGISPNFGDVIDKQLVDLIEGDKPRIAFDINAPGRVALKEALEAERASIDGTRAKAADALLAAINKSQLEVLRLPA